MFSPQHPPSGGGYQLGAVSNCLIIPVVEPARPHNCDESGRIAETDLTFKPEKAHKQQLNFMNASTNETTCRGCGLLCDDLTISISGNEIILSENTCSAAENWFQSATHLQEKSEKTQDTEKAISTAKKWIRESGSTLICGLNGLTLQAEAELINLARKNDAFLSAGTPPEKIDSYQRYGGASCTLGEVRQRADFVLLGNVDLCSIWPRFEKQILSKPSRFLCSSKPRQLIFFGDASLLAEPTRYSEVIDIRPDQFAQAILLLRRFCKNRSRPVESSGETESNQSLTSKTIDQIRELAERLLNAEYPVLFHDETLAEKNFLWSKLIGEVNQKSRLHSLTVSAGQAKGAVSDTVLAMTGFPDHVAFRNKEILHDPFRFQAARLIEKNEFDLVIYAGDSPGKNWSDSFQKLASNTRLILIHSGITSASPVKASLVEIVAQIPGIHEAGTTLRCDGVPLPLRSVIGSNRQTVTSIVQKLGE